MILFENPRDVHDNFKMVMKLKSWKARKVLVDFEAGRCLSEVVFMGTSLLDVGSRSPVPEPLSSYMLTDDRAV